MNVPDVQLAVARRGAEVAARPAIARTVASAITIGAGGSAGSEGPVVVLGAAIGSWMGRTFRFAAPRTAVLVGCASGAAISAAFNAPLAGAFFALEEIVGTFSGASFAPVVVASVTAAVVTRAIFGNHPAFAVPTQFGYGGMSEVLLWFPLLGLLAGGVAALYVRTYFVAGDTQRWLRSRFGLPPVALAVAAGALVGVLVFLSGGYLVGYGHLSVRLDVFGRMAWWALLLLALGKVLATSITLNFGGSGGVFTPSLFIGAATGGALGVLAQRLAPGAGIHPETYALVGMGAMIAGTTDAPITGILLVFEMTNDYGLVLPLMLTVVISHAVARRLEPDSLYSGWLRRRGERLQGGTAPDVLAALHVRDVMQPAAAVLFEGDALSAVLDHLGVSEQTYLPVVDDDGVLLGVVTGAELGRAAHLSTSLSGVLVAGDLARGTETVSPDEPLATAVRRMGARGTSALPVVEPATGRLLGVVSHAHVLDVYHRAAAQGHAPASIPA
jgi:CIC family chloride channel protein